MTRILTSAFYLFLIVLSLFSYKPVLAFDAGEHAIIGDVAYKKFSGLLPSQIKKLELPQNT